MKPSVVQIGAVRVEQDLLGEREVPANAYYGVHTLRAIENFVVSGMRISQYPDLIIALAAVKQAAAVANMRLGLLDADVATAIVAACEEIRQGELHDEFAVDVIQGGAGTSTNMNANEVIANRALEILGKERGEYSVVHPLEHVNLSQSTNDVYPTAMNIALVYSARRLICELRSLAAVFTEKSIEFAEVVKMGRTQLQDAVPMTLGQEFATYAGMVGKSTDRLESPIRSLHKINLGGTAIGTGINTHPRYAALATLELSKLAGLELESADDLVAATQDTSDFIQLSGDLRSAAVTLSKICNDLRLLSSGPRAGFGEVNLPPVQAGSSIMPGKVNPVIPEMVNQVAFEVMGNDLTAMMAGEAGQLQLNAFEPIIAHSLFKSISHLTAACSLLNIKCVAGITANASSMRAAVEHSIGIVTTLSPHIGYTAASALATEALSSTKKIPELVLERGLLSQRDLDRILGEGMFGVRKV